MRTPGRHVEALAGEPVQLLGMKAKSFLPMISKARGHKEDLSHLNIFHVVSNNAKSCAVVKHSTECE